MISEFLCLLCLGLCAGQGGREPGEPLPKPSLRVWPSSVAPPRSNVTLQCRSPTKDVHFTLRKGNIPLPFAQPPASTGGLAEFLLTDLRTSQAGKYTCEVHRGGLPSPPSDAVLLLVTGDFSKPSLQAHRRGVVTAGDNVTLQCQLQDYVFRRVMFALLKAGEVAPIQLRTPVGKETDFSLGTVTAGDSGNYSCVYFLYQAPFWASKPSDPLEVRVRAAPGALPASQMPANPGFSACHGQILAFLSSWCDSSWTPYTLTLDVEGRNPEKDGEAWDLNATLGHL
uniref:Ig-like domain-containing protein n=1 Tax=Suricata suricatta TaxID=37032 RepID=A0A673USG8_SURSU